MITHITGDLFDPAHDFQALGHGVNCAGVMGSGIAVPFRTLYPDMYTIYRGLCNNGVLKPGGIYPYWSEKDDRWVYNIASQNRPGADAKYEWLRAGLGRVRVHMIDHNITTLGLPLIGEGIGGLPSGTLSATVQEVFGDEDLDVTIVTWG